MTRTPLIAGNWKMNLDHQQAIALIQKIAWTLSDADFDHEAVEVLVTPPFTDLRSAQTLIDAEGFKLALGAQDLSEHDSGAFTGDISGEFLAKLNCQYVLVGHSERRTIHAEDDQKVNSKVSAAIRHGITPILCVGETLEQRNSGQLSVSVEQTLAALEGLTLDNLVVAYEPVWAIGTGEVATPEQAEEIIHSIRLGLAEKLGEDFAEKTRILYGGSVKANNVASFMKMPNIDGVLVGGASLDSEEFSNIARFREHIGV
jgi:triosephosphate isomerase